MNTASVSDRDRLARIAGQVVSGVTLVTAIAFSLKEWNQISSTLAVGDGVVDQLLSVAPVVVILRLVIVVVVSFAAGALVQRAILGRFVLKLGPLDLADLEARVNEVKNKDQEASVVLSFELERLREDLNILTTVVEGIIPIAISSSDEAASSGQHDGHGTQPRPHQQLDR